MEICFVCVVYRICRPAGVYIKPYEYLMSLWILYELHIKMATGWAFNVDVLVTWVCREGPSWYSPFFDIHLSLPASCAFAETRVHNTDGAPEAVVGLLMEAEVGSGFR